MGAEFVTEPTEAIERIREAVESSPSQSVVLSVSDVEALLDLVDEGE